MMRGMLVLMQKSADPAICHIRLQQGRQRRKDTEHIEIEGIDRSSVTYRSETEMAAIDLEPC